MNASSTPILMLSAIEIRAACNGLLLLLRFDAGFVNWFDRSALGARRSFRLMLPLLPLAVIRIFLNYDKSPDIGALETGLSIAVFYVLSWICFPLLLIVIGRALERENQAIAVLSVYNWFGFALSVATFLISLAGLFEPLQAIVDLLLWVVIIGSLIYEAYLLNIALGIGYFGAGLLSVVDLIIAQSLFVALLIYPTVICTPTV